MLGSSPSLHFTPCFSKSQSFQFIFMSVPECLDSQQAAWGSGEVRDSRGMEGGMIRCRRSGLSSPWLPLAAGRLKLHLALEHPSGCYSDRKSVRANSLGGLLCMILTETSPDGITVVLLIYSHKISLNTSARAHTDTHQEERTHIPFHSWIQASCCAFYRLR